MTRTHRVTIYTRDGSYRSEIFVRDMGDGREMIDVDKTRESVFRMTGEFPIARWHATTEEAR